MMQEQSIDIRYNLRQIAEMLIINGSLLESPGLWYGKMGVAVFFFHYAQYAENELFEDYAVEIIQAIQADIHHDSITDYDRGLAGIGTGIEYLSQNGFLAIDANEVLEDFDRRIRQNIVYRQEENNSLGNGLCGLGQYFLNRKNGCYTGSDELGLLSNHEVIVHLVNILENGGELRNSDLPDVLSFLCSLYSLNICNPQIDQYLDQLVKKITIHDISNEYLPNWALALIRMVPIRSKIIDLAEHCIKKTIQVMENMTSTQEQMMNETNQLLWLLQCKRLIKQNGVNTDLIDP